MKPIKEQLWGSNNDMEKPDGVSYAIGDFILFKLFNEVIDKVRIFHPPQEILRDETN